MKVIKTFILLIICSISQNIIAQNTQIGYVKTKGRMVNGKLVPGVPLSGAVVTIAGRVVVTNNKGEFQFPISDSIFTIQSVKKKGYELVDVDVYRTYKYSQHPLYIIMETPEQQMKDKLEAERKIRGILQRRLQEREDEIETQIASQQEKDSLLRILYQQQTDYERLIRDMAEGYSNTDYDQLNVCNQQISQNILNVELQKADSLLRKKGDIETRIRELLESKAWLEEEESKLKKESEDLIRKEKEILSKDCYAKFEIHKTRQENDSASLYLDLRAQLDTTDYKLATETGNIFLEELSNDNKALSYFTRAKEIAIQNYSSEHPDVASSLQSIGNVFLFRGNYNEAIKQYNLSLELYRTLMGDSSRYVALSLMNVGIASNSMRKYDIALDYYKKSIEIFENIYKTDNNIDIADVYNNMGVSYENKKEYELALDYYRKALKIRNAIYDYKHQDVATSYCNIAGVYDALGEYKSAIENYQKSIEIFKVARGNNHPDVALAYNNLASTYFNMDDYTNAKIYFELSLQILSRVLPSDHPEIRAVKENIDTLKSYMNN